MKESNIIKQAILDQEERNRLYWEEKEKEEETKSK